MRLQKLLSAAVLCTLCAALLAGCAGPQAAVSSAPPEGTLLTVDGYPVPAEEFQLFLAEEYALTAAYFGRTYGAEIDSGFWSRDFNGITPDEYARDAALQELLTAKMESILLKERGLVDDISYGGLMASLAETNADRADKLSKGEVFYGLTEYDAATYYAYVRSQRWGELVRSQSEYNTPSSEELRATYENNPGYFTSLPMYTCRFAYGDGTVEDKEISAESVHKEDEAGAELLTVLAETAPGDALYGMSLDGRAADVTLISVQPGEPLPFEDDNVQAQLASLCREDALNALLLKRVADAELVIDQALYEAQTLS